MPGVRGLRLFLAVSALGGVCAPMAHAGTTIDTGSTTLGKANGLVYRIATSQTITIGQSRGAAAECAAGSGRKTTGGGAGIPGSGFTEALSDSAPIPGFPASRFWVGTFTNHSGSNDSVVAYAICGKPDHRELTQKTVQNAPANTALSLKTSCPQDTEVSGGGISFANDDGQFSDSTPFDSARDEDKRPDDGWKVTAYPTATTDVTVVAICVRGLSLAYRSTTSGPLENTSYDAQSLCEADEAVTGGGGSISGPSPGAYVMFTVPENFGPGEVPDDLWGFNTIIGPGTPRNITSVAICKR